MQTATPLKPRSYFAADVVHSRTFAGHAISMNSDGSALVKDVPIFKVGTFRDSWGDQHTWVSDHLNQMVANFDLLKKDDKFTDVPVRADHSFSVEKVIGYIESLRSDGQFLYGNFHVTEPTALDKLARGTYRSVSLEVGMFVANDESAYWPVTFGVAYVDIPAVEGLHSKNMPISYFSMATDLKETTVPEPATQTVPAGTTINLFSQGDATPPTPPTPTPAPAPSPPPTPPTPGQTHAFRINGQETTDFAAVQARIDALELFQTDSQKNARIEFVKQLVKDGKVGAPQEASLIEMVTDADFSEAQYAKFTKSYEAATKLSLFAQHGAGEPNQGDEIDKVADRRDVLNQTIEMHRRAGMTSEQLAKTSAALELVALNATKS